MKFKSKPIEVEAVQLQAGEESLAEVQTLTGGLAEPASDGAVTIPTRDGIKTASIGDWIIKGADAELSRCLPENFAANYEAVTVKAPKSPKV